MEQSKSSLFEPKGVVLGAIKEAIEDEAVEGEVEEVVNGEADPDNEGGFQKVFVRYFMLGEQVGEVDFHLVFSKPTRLKAAFFSLWIDNPARNLVREHCHIRIHDENDARQKNPLLF